MDVDELSGPQRKVLREAILAGFDRQSLDMFLQEQLSKPSLDALVAPGGFEKQAFELIKVMQNAGWTSAFATAAQKASGHPKIKNLITNLELIAVERDSESNKHLVQQSLERTVREKTGYADFVQWAEKLSDLRRNVCRIEDVTVSQKALGTGFLIASDLVLTNYHVVQSHIEGALSAQNLACRFDYAIETGGENPGISKPIADKWLIAKSPCSAHDTGDQGGVPEPGELDYALLRLAGAAGDDVVDGKEQKRGWISLSGVAPLPTAGDVIFIVQHPKGGPLKLGVGTVLKLNSNATRLRYDANTTNGSSGSPCFDANLNLVALHHGGDPDTGRLAQYNQGIPIDCIGAHLSASSAVPRL